jgi:hypothetical protein
MRRFIAHLSAVSVAACAGLWTILPASAQELRLQPTPFSAWLDLQSARTFSAKQAPLPIWLESVQRSTTQSPQKTTLRFRFRRLGQLSNEIEFRVFFDDQPGQQPTLSGWTETGRELYRSQPLGLGLGLPSSEKLLIPVAGMDYLDVEVPGDGKSLRSVFLATLQTTQTRHAIDFDAPPEVTDPFASPPAATPSEEDRYLFGRVKATLEAGPIRLGSGQITQTDLQFELDAAPLIAVVRFEVLGADPVDPLELTVNQRPLGRVAIQLPDLADPGFQGIVKPLEADMRFRYAGWVRCQQVIPGSALQKGINQLSLAISRQSSPVAIRSIELELKNAWKHLDYQLAP